MPGLEVPIFTPASAATALARGATRLEVNRAGSYPQGGLTPDDAEVESLSGSPAPLRIMIRPRGAPPSGGPDFVYTDDELDGMKGGIRRFVACGQLRVERGDGFVFGVLKEEDGRGRGQGRGASAALVVAVDVERNSELVRLARPFPCVFHRAFDDVLGRRGGGGDGGDGGPFAAAAVVAEEALRDVAGCGFDGVLTSGGPGSAADNVEMLACILQRAAGLEIIVGGGVRSSNLGVLRDGILCRTGAGGLRVWFHSSCLTGRSGDDGVDGEEVGKIASGLGAR